MSFYADTCLRLESIALATVPLTPSEMGKEKQSVSYRFLYFRAGACEITLDGRTYILRSTDLSVAEIAQLYHFSDFSHLARVYRKWTGRSPSRKDRYKRE